LTTPPSIGLAGGAAVVHVGMLLLWLAQRRSRNAGVVDAGWTAAVAGLAITHAATGSGDPIRRAAIAAFAGIWGVRLLAHLVMRLRREPEDGRYRAMRTNWGSAAQRNLFWLFQAQALLALLLTLPFLAVAGIAAPLPPAALAAAALLFTIAIAGESLADAQLASFRADPRHRGRTCRVGLWRWSRHPNYFFEWLHWWAYVPLAWGSGWVAAALAVPAVMLLLILFVSGIPPTEAQSLRSRGEDYRDYQLTTSAFFPWPPRRSAA
jgi:steroid 5-alpha reductase family enzyme